MIFLDLFVMGGYWQIFRPSEPRLVVVLPPVHESVVPAQNQPTIAESARKNIIFPPAKMEFKLPELGKRPGKNKYIAIIIDDMGPDLKRSRRAIHDLPAEVTLSFLPYAPHLKAMTREARAKGHELMLHLPMQPVNPALNPGPNVLEAGMEEGQVDQILGQALQSFEGYAGLNNHMGSKASADERLMSILMRYLKDRGVFFIDSKTSQDSIAEKVAREQGLPYAARDVFLDHEESSEFAVQSLEQLESIAQRRGQAIAIGHPKDITLKALEEWIPTLADKGIELVPASQLVHQPFYSSRAP